MVREGYLCMRVSHRRPRSFIIFTIITCKYGLFICYGCGVGLWLGIRVHVREERVFPFGNCGEPRSRICLTRWYMKRRFSNGGRNIVAGDFRRSAGARAVITPCIKME